MSLSIIIPHFNQPDLLEKLLASIPQDKKDIQTIVVDDKSDLISLKKVELLKNSYKFEFYENNRNKSAGICRNIGLQKAKNKWVTFADGDDYFVKGFYDIVSKYFDSSADVAFFSPTSQYLDTKKVAERHLSFDKIIKDYLKDPNKLNELMLRYNFISTWSKMMKKNFMYKYQIKFDEGPMGAEDVILSTKIGYYMKKFEVCSEIVYCLITRYGSSTRTHNEIQFNIRLLTRISRIKFLNTNLKQSDLKLIRPLISNKAAELLFLSLKSYGIKKFLEVYNLYKKENIKWFRFSYMNPYKLLKYLFMLYFQNLKNSKYIVIKNN